MKIILSLLCILISASIFAQNNIEEGKTIFKNRCASCHHVEKRLTGPALKGVNERRDTEWVIKFVHSSQSMVNSGDEQAVALFNEYNKTIMPDHKDLTNAQIENIVLYIKEETERLKNVKTPAYTPPYVEPYEKKNSIIDNLVYLNFKEKYKPIKKDDTFSWIFIGFIVLSLIAILRLLVFSNQLEAFIEKRFKTNNKNS